MDEILKEIKKVDTTNRVNTKPLDDIFNAKLEEIIAQSMDMRRKWFGEEKE